MLDLRRLRLLRQLKRRGTITAVAEALSYSPSAVSRQLSTLEKETGVALLEPAGTWGYASDDLLVHLVLIEHDRALGLLPALVTARGTPGLQRTPTGAARTCSR